VQPVRSGAHGLDGPEYWIRLQEVDEVRHGFSKTAPACAHGQSAPLVNAKNPAVSKGAVECLEMFGRLRGFQWMLFGFVAEEFNELH
jgi:hypothetical protein